MVDWPHSTLAAPQDSQLDNQQDSPLYRREFLRGSLQDYPLDNLLEYPLHDPLDCPLDCPLEYLLEYQQTTVKQFNLLIIKYYMNVY